MPQPQPDSGRPDLSGVPSHPLTAHTSAASSEPDIPAPDFDTRDAAAHPLPVFESLHITRLIGRGGQGLVFEAIRDQPRQVVAVKVPRADGDLTQRSANLRREADLLAGLNHPNIVKVLQVTAGTLNGQSIPCVVTELIEDAHSITRYSQRAELTPRHRVELIIKVARAVQHIHERLRAFHRDLKPANILVGRDGEPRIIDLGMAVSGETDQRLHERGYLVGTPDYMAPEQFDRDPAYLTQRTDVYALGIILYELLAGFLPYDLAGLSREEKQQVIQLHPPRPLPPECIADCPALAPVIEIALRKETSRKPADHRFPTPGVFADELEAALKSGSTLSPAATGSDSPRPSPTARVLRVLPFIAAALALAFGLIWGDSLARSIGLIDRFEQAAFRTVPPAVRARPFSRAAVVGFHSGEDVRSAAELLRSRGITLPPIDPAKPRTWRPLYAELLRALHDSGTDAVVFDIVFKVPAEVDELFADAAARAPFPIIVGLDTGVFDNPDAHAHSPTILRPPVQWGGVNAVFGGQAAWTADLLHERGTQFSRPTIALRTFAAVNYPRAIHRFSLSADGREIHVDADTPQPAAPSLSQPAGPTSRVPVTACELVRNPSPEDQLDFGFRDGDRVAQLMLALPDQPSLDAITHSLLDILTAPPDTLRDRFNRRAVFVANKTMSPLSGDLFGHPDGRQIWGVYGHAAAYEALISGKSIRSIDPPFQVALTATAAAFPLLAFGSSRRRSIPSLLLGVTLSALVLALLIVMALLTLRSALWYATPFPAAAALAASTILLAVLLIITRSPRLSRAPSETRHAVRPHA